MARLIDYLLADGKSVLTYDYDLLAEAQYLAIDNVARYYYESEQFYQLVDFPNIAPPFDNFFMDFHAPTRVYDANLQQIAHSDDGTRWMGLHAFVVDPKEVEKRTQTTKDIQDEFSVLLKKEDVRWCMYIRPHALHRSGYYLGVNGCWIIPIRQDGIAVPWIRNGGESLCCVGKWDSSDAQALANHALAWLSPLFLAISFMHCKNVTMVQQTPPVPLSKKFQKNHGRPLVRYHILNIEPMKQVLRTEGQSEQTGLKKALHICRGHFKDYRERGLFGKVKGLFWWDSHVRGTVEAGIVDKDYRVKEPKQ